MNKFYLAMNQAVESFILADADVFSFGSAIKQLPLLARIKLYLGIER